MGSPHWCCWQKPYIFASKKSSESKRPKPPCGTQKQVLFWKTQRFMMPKFWILPILDSLTCQTPRTSHPPGYIASSSKVAIFARYIASLMGTTSARCKPPKLTSELPFFSQKNVRFCIFNMANIRKGLCVAIRSRWQQKIEGVHKFLAPAAHAGPEGDSGRQTTTCGRHKDKGVKPC